MTSKMTMHILIGVAIGVFIVPRVRGVVGL